MWIKTSNVQRFPIGVISYTYVNSSQTKLNNTEEEGFHCVNRLFVYRDIECGNCFEDRESRIEANVRNAIQLWVL